MEGNKSFKMYIFVFLFIGAIMFFVVLPNEGVKVLNCNMEKMDSGIDTIYNIKSFYHNNKFSNVKVTMELVLNESWYNKSNYIYSLNKDSSEWIELGFNFDVEENEKEKTLTAIMSGERNDLNNGLIYYSSIDKVYEYFENSGYKCEVGEE